MPKAFHFTDALVAAPSPARWIVLLAVIIVIVSRATPGGAQSTYFKLCPVWSSGPNNVTFSVALGDVDGDGDLDLVCGNDDQSNTLYLNEG